jgi:hypothetical protein
MASVSIHRGEPLFSRLRKYSRQTILDALSPHVTTRVYHDCCLKTWLTKVVDEQWKVPENPVNAGDSPVRDPSGRLG